MTVAWELLRALGLRQRGPEIISCPTCGRTEIDLIGLAQEVERRLRTENAPIKVAVMGCVVNGPGEAREADLGMAGGRDKGIIFRKGEVIRSVRGRKPCLPHSWKNWINCLSSDETCSCPGDNKREVDASLLLLFPPSGTEVRKRVSLCYTDQAMRAARHLPLFSAQWL